MVPGPVPRPDSVLVPPKATVWTVGHSTRSLEAFLALLRERRIEILQDVRHFPTSARAPWSSAEVLPANLYAAGIVYEHAGDLGGFREPRADSSNTGWRNRGFRGYADYMDTPGFAAARDRLIGLARAHRAAVMCAEAVPWRCHRSLLADALVARGLRVVHILGPGRDQDHALTRFAKVQGGRVTYPAARGKA